jgi:hypothetical protein
MVQMFPPLALEAIVVGGAGVDTNVDYVGQAGGYASRLFAQLGKRTGYIGPVGDDHNGRLVRDSSVLRVMACLGPRSSISTMRVAPRPHRGSAA